jgi:hypothetical protein
MSWSPNKKTPKGFASGIKTARERNRAKQPKKKGSASKLGWGSKKSKSKKTSERLPVGQSPSYKVQNIKIADINPSRRWVSRARLRCGQYGARLTIIWSLACIG